MKTLNSNELSFVFGGADEPNPIQVVAGSSSIAAGTGISVSGGGAAITCTAGSIAAGAVVVVLGGLGGYLIGDFIEQKTGVGAAVGDVAGVVGWHIANAVETMPHPDAHPYPF